MAPSYPTVELDRNQSSRSTSRYGLRQDHSSHSSLSTSPNSLRLMTELENLALREPDSPVSYHSSGQNGSPGDLLHPAFRPRARGSSVTSQSSERGLRKEALGSPHPLVGDERFDTTHVQPAELDDSIFQDDEERDERFSNPVKYFDDLDQLEEDLADHSSLNIYDHEETFKLFPDPSELSSVTPKSDVELLHLFENHKDEAYGQTGFHLLQCRNIVFAAYDNCCKLQANDFGGSRINFLRADQHRSNVAKLSHYDALSIKSLAEDFDYALSEYLLQENSKKLARKVLERLTQHCDASLQEMGLWIWDMNYHQDEVRWYCVAQSLDLAILSFVGAHTQNFAKFLSNEPQSFDIPNPTFQLPAQITLHQRNFQCLDRLFCDKPIWVFHPSSKAAAVNEPLYLSVNMKSFSHIWGPVWAISTSGHVGSGVRRYDVGGGSIIPWRHSRNRDPELQPGEKFCHWTPYEEIKDVNPTRVTFGEEDTLLIGANVRLQPNDENCPFKPEDLMERLQDSNSIHELGTSESTFHVDSQSSAISLGGWGLNVSGSRSFKKRDGQTLKAALLERWDHDLDGSRMIRALDKGYGLEMSYCSLNARRTTLFNLLRTKDMMKYLRTLVWEDDGCAMRVLEILQNETTQDIRQLYLRCHEWRKDIRKSILHALRILAKCTVDGSTHELSIPWISEDAENSVTFSKSDISWTGFLQDTRDSSTFGLLSNKCLSFKQPRGRICGKHSGSPVLQTSLRVNKSMTENFMRLKQRGSGEYYWSIAAIRKKLRFPLGSQGNLTVVGLVGMKAALLMEWTAEAEAKAFVKRALRWNGGKHHQEFIRANWNAKERPIHIFIASKYEVPGIPKRYRKHRHRRSDTQEDYYLPGASVPQITYKPHNASAGSSPSRRGVQIVRTESGSSAPISISRSSSSQSQHDEETSMDITGDDGNALSVRNRWTWDKNYKQWRKHVYKDGELEYTMWTRNPDLDEG